jgi:hypothetical protein
MLLLVFTVAFFLALNCGVTLVEVLFTTLALLLLAGVEPCVGVFVFVFVLFCAAEPLSVFAGVDDITD